ncbi:hypothetical protein AVEN_152747-1 [Araneus ventricosus]|uniref:Uncharacterized protein n=1 Tax=Araneus ventricosus TaxID=182803 RepID=A0A4Y2NIF2_ARAVE|nr:hypothetical protein AVEN_152747-1 [Araneus ventricosus]
MDKKLRFGSVSAEISALPFIRSEHLASSEKNVNPSSKKTDLTPAEQEIKLWKCDVKENRLSEVPLLSGRNDQLMFLRKDYLDFLVEGRKGSSSILFFWLKLRNRSINIEIKIHKCSIVIKIHN